MGFKIFFQLFPESLIISDFLAAGTDGQKPPEDFDLDMGFDPGQQFFRIERFGHIVHPADLKPFDHIIGFCLGSQKNDRNMPGRQIGLDFSHTVYPSISGIIMSNRIRSGSF